MSTNTMSLRESSEKYGPLDIIVEGTGYSPLVFEAMDVLAKNGVLVMVSVTGGERNLEIPADKINLEFVLGNKVADRVREARWDNASTLETVLIASLYACANRFSAGIGLIADF